MGLTATDAWAGQRAVEVGAYAGYRTGGDLEDAFTGADLEIDESSSFGVQVSIEQTPGRYVEIWYARQSGQVVPEQAFASDVLLDIDVHNLHLGGTAAIDNQGRWRPFVSGGIGFTRLDPQGPGSSETDVSFALGVGGKYYLTPRTGLRLDARWIFTLTDERGFILCADGGCAIGVDGSGLHQVEVGAGLFVVF